MFTSYSYLILLSDPLISLFDNVPQVLSAAACLGRIQEFLDRDPRQDFRTSFGGQYPPEKPSHELASVGDQGRRDTPMVTISKGNFGWTEEIMALVNIDLVIPTQQLTMIVGPMASGKTTLCKVLLGEVPFSKGQVVLRSSSRRIGFCDQNPFLANETIKQNIVGFSPFNEGRYSEVIEATMLTVDLLALPQGDETKAGSNGITLSGGQKQRVSMARALYLETEFFLFDDILSGLDADTEEQVFRRVFGPNGLIKRRGATAVLCTHSVRHLPSADHIIALSDGSIAEQGNFDDLMANQKYVHGLGVKVHTSEQRSLASLGIAGDSENINTDPLLLAKAPTVKTIQSENELAARRHGDRKVYKHYYKSIGFWPASVFALFALVCGFFYSFQSVWITLWSTGMSADPPAHRNTFYLGLFATFQVFGLLSLYAVVRVVMSWIIGLSGSALHEAALKTVVNAPLRFFTTTDTGVATNYFSQDMTIIDGDLPFALVNVAIDIAMCLGMAAVIATVSRAQEHTWSPLLSSRRIPVHSSRTSKNSEPKKMDL